jgi:hypothetical protein
MYLKKRTDNSEIVDIVFFQFFLPLQYYFPKRAFINKLYILSNYLTTFFFIFFYLLV